MLDVKITGKHADLIRNGDYEIYGADWLRYTIKCLMGEAYKSGMLHEYPFNKELQKSGGDGWKKLHTNFDERINTMLDIGVERIYEGEKE